MAITVKENDGGIILEIRLAGRLFKEDYEAFVPTVKRLVEQQGRARLLVLMQDFQHWTPGALRADIEFAAHHFRHIERLAVVGETKWQHGMAVSCEPFAAAAVERFDRSALDEAKAWLNAP
jgi:hypothetical protein